MKSPLPYEFGTSGPWSTAYDSKPGHLSRLNRLTGLDEATIIKKICRHYIANFIPSPVENEDIYWIISCFPSTDRSPIRISIWFPEVFNITPAHKYFGRGEKLQCMVFVHDAFLDDHAKKILTQSVKGLFFVPAYRFRTGIPEQLAAFMPLDSYFDFVADEAIYEGIRTHNYELSLKGRTPFKKGHNYELVRYLFGFDDGW